MSTAKGKNMRIWDINPGYLNRQSLLGEHRELHAVVSIITNNKKGYSRHPEVLRWVGFGWALRQRHQLLSAEMALRGYNEKTPVRLRSNKNIWPEHFIDEPHVQFRLIKEKYVEKEKGRIPLPETAQQLWSHHKYSIMARDNNLYKQFGRMASKKPSEVDFPGFSNRLVMEMRKIPPPGGIYNSLLHMWGYVSSSYEGERHRIQNWSSRKLLKEIQRLAFLTKKTYLISSTALSELKIWL